MARRSDFGLFLAEGFDDPHAVGVLVHDLGHIALALLAVPGRGEDASAHPVGNGEESRGDDDADERQHRREVDHHRQRHQHQQDVAAHDWEEVKRPWTSVESELALAMS